MRRLELRLAWLLLAAACTRSPEPTPVMTAERQTVAPAHGPPDAASVPVIAPPDAAPASVAAPTSRGCIIDPGAETACLARGSGFAYGPTPFIYCSGVAADTAALARQQAQAQQNQPCVCNNLREIDQQRDSCSMVPSTPGR